jgi:[acyl-carrier-protein] S-malonyltransferase
MSIAWLFPGQGSQSVGMAKDVLDASPLARDVFARVDEALGEKLSRLILEGPEAELTLTVNLQPALVATSMAILAAIRERVPDLAPAAFGAGHSLGEYSALVSAEAITLEDAVRLVRARGRAMQDAVAPGVGAMAAILSVDEGKLDALCRDLAENEIVSPANYNSPGQIVIAGHAAAVARVSARVGEIGGKAIPLKVSAPFHCALMAPAARVLERELAQIQVQKPRFPIVANFDAEPNQNEVRVKELLVRQVDGAVRWEQTVRFMHERGVTLAPEIGPGKVLAGLCKRIARGIRVLSVSDMAALDQVASFLSTPDGVGRG